MARRTLAETLLGEPHTDKFLPGLAVEAVVGASLGSGQMFASGEAEAGARGCRCSNLVAAEGNGCLPDSGADIQRLTAAVAFH